MARHMDRSGPVGEQTADQLWLQARRKRAGADRVRTTGEWLGRALWVVAALALAFTCANVTQFATGHGTSVWIAWLLDPMASLALLVVLIGEAVLSEHGYAAGGWSTVLKWAAGASTWVMNVWQSAQAKDTAGMVLHSVPPALVILLAEVTPLYRARFADLAARLEAEADALDARAAAAETADLAPAGPAPVLAAVDRTELDRATGPTTGPADGPVDGPDRAMDRSTGVDRRTSGPVVRLVSDRTTDRATDRATDRTTDRTMDRTTTVARRASVPAARSGRVDRTGGEDRTAALLPKARRIADRHLAKTGRQIARRPLAEALRATGETCSTDTAATLLDLLAAQAQPQAALQTQVEVQPVVDVDQADDQGDVVGQEDAQEGEQGAGQEIEAPELVAVGEHVG